MFWALVSLRTKRGGKGRQFNSLGLCVLFPRAQISDQIYWIEFRINLLGTQEPAIHFALGISMST